MIETAPLRLELETRYLAYALSTIISRSLPDVRDGLKPVHRRILFAMRALHLDPGAAYKKSARVVGDVIGKFHPHGDQAAYDAMVRLAQDFAARYPLVDGQGNFGNIDGDGAAAMRYTEARLTLAAQAMMEDLNLDVVNFVDTYDGSLQEPSVLPARFPNLLANGSTGIAVGMSTSIPPHNVGEVIDACLLLIREPEATVARLLEILPGPDFPTGGLLVSDLEERLAVYQTGRGTVRLRGRVIKEELPRGAWRLVVTEIPYQIQKSRLIEKIAQTIVDHTCPFLEDIRDESDEQVRIVLEPKSIRMDPEMVLAYLYKNTDLEIRVTMNFNVIDQGRPRVMDLAGLLRAWLAHRLEVHNRRARFELANALSSGFAGPVYAVNPNGGEVLG
ncbi:MAG: DNA topoisomerase IV subunit A, partial [Magnetococcales bacterium]|nr:DNA topoisomerase IV subunit A [Magnetococcales bacterium]